MSFESNQEPDLLPHKHQPDCTSSEALKLKQWIQDFMNISNGLNSNAKNKLESDDDSSFGGSDCGGHSEVFKKCFLLTGPPGSGKTSLVYSVANELKLHVVESHPSDKRDSKLFNMLKLTNQIGKINTIARLFQVAQIKQQQQQQQLMKKRKLTVSGDTSIVLFDDIDIVFEEDGPFLKSLVEFIKESKRPVILTASSSLECIMRALIFFEHIHLDKLYISDCASALKVICKKENYKKLNNKLSCQLIVDYYNCDIRKCLNNIHFYGDQVETNILLNRNNQLIPEFTNLDLKRAVVYGNETNQNQIIKQDDEETLLLYAGNNKAILNCYTNCILTDLIETTTMKLRENEGYCLNGLLSEQIKESIINLTKDLYPHYLMSATSDDCFVRQKFSNRNTTNRKQQILRKEFCKKVFETSELINEKIKSRIEPPDRDFYIDIIPSLGELINLEVKNKLQKNNQQGLTATTNFRRSRRSISYLESINVYFESKDIGTIYEFLLKSDDYSQNSACSSETQDVDNKQDWLND